MVRHHCNLVRPLAAGSHGSDGCAGEAIAELPTHEHDFAPIGRPVAGNCIVEQFPCLSTHDRHPVKRVAPREDDHRAIVGEARKVVGNPRRERDLASTGDFLQPDPPPAVAIGTERNQAAVVRGGGGMIVIGVGKVANGAGL